MRVMTLVGTRPEIIRLSRVIARFDEAFEHVLVHSGQNWDPSLSEVFFKDLGLREPDMNLRVDTGSLGSVIAGVLQGVERLIADIRPDAFLVLGDTNTALGLLMAKRMKVPTYHMEAGNRCFDQNVPEETNRRVIDHAADFNLVYSEAARRNLLQEGLPSRQIFLTGSPLREVLDHYRSQIQASDVLDRLGLQSQNYLLVSVHREETVDHPRRLLEFVENVSELADYFGVTAVVSTHPRTRKRLQEAGIELTAPALRWLPPFGFFDYNKLQLEALCVLSDSGTISEEADILGLRAVTLRASMERPEALEAGVLTMHDVASPDLLGTTQRTLAEQVRVNQVPDYSVLDTSLRVVRVLHSTAPLHPFWTGLRGSNHG